MLAKHKWIQIPDKWVTLGHPPEGATINLHIALKSDRENALIDALKEVSQPSNPKYVLLATPLFETCSCISLLRF